jgi:hypothetical protein
MFAECFLSATRQSLCGVPSRPSAKKKRHGRRQDGDREFAECQDGKTLGKHIVFFFKNALLWCGSNPNRIQRRCPELNTGDTFHKNPASLAYIRCSGCYAFPYFCPWARPGPMTCNHIAGEPCGSRIEKPPSISWLNSKASLFLRLCLMNQACSGFFLTWSLEVVLSLKKSFEWRAFFQRKRALMSVALEPLAIWNKRLEGLEFWLLKELEISSEDMYPALPDHLSGFFLLSRTRIEGLLSSS